MLNLNELLGNSLEQLLESKDLTLDHLEKFLFLKFNHAELDTSFIRIKDNTFFLTENGTIYSIVFLNNNWTWELQLSAICHMNNRASEIKKSFYIVPEKSQKSLLKYSHIWSDKYRIFVIESDEILKLKEPLLNRLVTDSV